MQRQPINPWSCPKSWDSIRPSSSTATSVSPFAADKTR